MKRTWLPIIVLSAISYAVVWVIRTLVPITFIPGAVSLMWSLVVLLVGELLGSVLFGWPKLWANRIDYLLHEFYFPAFYMLIIAMLQGWLGNAGNRAVILYQLGPLFFACIYVGRMLYLISENEPAVRKELRPLGK